MPTPVNGAYFYPSPARGDSGALRYEMAKAGDVVLKVFNQTGRLVDTVKETKSAGWQSSQVSVGRFAPGTYYYLLSIQYAGSDPEVQSPGKFTVMH